VDQYRIDYTITRRRDGEDDFTEIGFGSSGSAATPSDAAYAVQSAADNGDWETTPGMPDPQAVRREAEGI
jgi:hypothetical protein